MTNSTPVPAPTVWPALRYDDAPGALRFLVDVLGFREALVSDRVDEVHAACRRAGATIVSALEDTDYGSHTFTVRDPEGNLWTVGSYRGAP